MTDCLLTNTPIPTTVDKTVSMNIVKNDTFHSILKHCYGVAKAGQLVLDQLAVHNETQTMENSLQNVIIQREEEKADVPLTVNNNT